MRATSAVCLLAANVPKFRRCSSEEAASIQPPLSVAVRENAQYSDLTGQRAVGVSASNKPLFACMSASYGDASVTGNRVIDDNSVVGGIY